MKTPVIYLLAVVSLFWTACQDSVSDQPDTPRRDIVLSTKGTEINQSTQKFSFRLLRTIASEKETNFCLSPLSASLCMGMVLNGANGETYTQLQQSLGYENYSTQEINEYVRSLQTELPSLDKKTLFTSANSLWIREDFPVHADFVQLNKEYYLAEVRTEPFTQTTVDRINQWCNDHTAGRIPSIIQQLSPNDVSVLINALYFKGIWSSEFKKENTRDEHFYTSEGRILSVPTMHQTAAFPYYSDEEIRIVELPYGNEAFSMVLFLPTDPARMSIDELLCNLTDEKWEEWNSGLQKQSLELSLPRFKMKYEKILNKVFEEMGSTYVFDSEQADFSKISNKRICLGLLKQKTFIEVDEKGTEAAAVTAGVFFSDTMPVSREVRFDHPFGFVIKEKSTNAILFAGKVGSPV